MPSPALGTLPRPYRVRARLRTGRPYFSSDDPPPPTTVGDARFDRIWTEWASLARVDRLAFLKRTDASKLVSLLASSQLASNPYERNVVASALANRVQAMEHPEQSPEDRQRAQQGFVLEMIAETQARCRVSREAASATKALLKRNASAPTRGETLPS